MVPIGAGILAVVAAQETARRAVASNYGRGALGGRSASVRRVQLTPPFLIPALPLGSVGCMGVVSRRMSTAPTREAHRRGI